MWLSDHILRKGIGILLLFNVLLSQQDSPVFHKTPEIAISGEPLEITISLFDDISILESTLFYRTPGQHSYREIQMRHAGLSWVGTIPGEYIDDFGIEYAIILLLSNGGTIGFPENEPFENPICVPVRSVADTGRRFRGSDQYSAEQMMDAELLILSPEPGSDNLPSNIVIAASFFHAPFVDSSSIQVLVDDKDYTTQTLITDGLINLVPESLEPGHHNISIKLKTVYGVTIKPVNWSFTVIKSGFNLKEQLIYSGDANTRSSMEYNGGSILNVSDASVKMNGSITWMGVKTNLRLSTKESDYLQPYNRFSMELLFGDYLSIKMGDYFPSINAFTINGKRIRGLGVQIRLPWVKFHSVSGTINRPVHWKGESNQGYVFNTSDLKTDTTGSYIFPLDRTGYTFKREVNAYQLFIQPIKRFSLGLHFLKATDDNTSVNRMLPDNATFVVDTLITSDNYTYQSFIQAVQQFGGTVNFPASNWKGGDPKDNVVAGFAIATLFDNNKLRFELDWNISLYNRNIWDGAMSIAELDTALDDSLDGWIGTQYDENGLILPGSLLIDTLALFNPLDYENLFTVNQYMIPLVPIDIASYSDTPIATIMNMPSTAYAIRLIGNYHINNFTIEYHQVGPEFVSLGNPYMTNNIREFTMKNRIRLMENKLILSAGYQHRDNKILKTTVDPLNTNTFSASMTLMPGADAPTLMFNIQSIGKNNEKEEINLIGSERVDLRENSRTVQTTMSLNYPFPTPTSSHNIVINFNTVKNTDNYESERLDGYLFPKTDTRSYSINMSSRFPTSLRTVFSSSITELALPTISSTGEITTKPFVWTAASFNGSYAINNTKLRVLGGINWMNSNGDINSNIFGIRMGGNYTIMENMTANLSSNFRIMNTEKTWGMNSYGVLLTIGYRF